MKNTCSDFQNLLLMRSETFELLASIRSELYKRKQRIIAQGKMSLIFYKDLFIFEKDVSYKYVDSDMELIRSPKSRNLGCDDSFNIL